MEIIKYQPAYRESCLHIFESNQPRFFAQEEKQLFTHWLDHDTANDYFVVKKGETVVACGGVYYDARRQEGGLTWGMVHAQHHGQGIGRMFTRHRIGLLRSRYPGIVIKIETSQHTTAFYGKLGFRTAAIVPDGFGQGLDQYHMLLAPDAG